MKAFALLCLLIANVSYGTLKREPKGEYLITTSKSLEAVAKTLKKNPPDHIKPMGHGRYVIKYKKDPGLEAIKKNLDNTFKIQPNFVYKSLN